MNSYINKNVKNSYLYLFIFIVIFTSYILGFVFDEDLQVEVKLILLMNGQVFLNLKN